MHIVSLLLLKMFSDVSVFWTQFTLYTEVGRYAILRVEGHVLQRF